MKHQVHEVPATGRQKKCDSILILETESASHEEDKGRTVVKLLSLPLLESLSGEFPGSLEHWKAYKPFMQIGSEMTLKAKPHLDSLVSSLMSSLDLNRNILKAF